MGIAAFLLAGGLAFGLAFWLTRRLRQPRARIARGLGSHRPGRGTRRGRRSPLTTANPAVASDLDRQVQDLLNQGKLIDAIHHVSATNGCSLRDAKAYVDERLP
ncbi:hypothetical protein [Leptolyngbya sp. KIOST-1]|uniref:hypothetical protein n=1 Tax=Leptolyngbya sp. KIOST-1 TaxID=1229172 RepID=UPI000560BF62|nr:hypothetical protein [Leptolyngbya sp. KIOST-1]